MKVVPTLLLHNLPFKGRLMVLNWAVYCTFILFFYTSVLRSVLVAQDYEKAIDTHEDVVERGQAVYIPDHIQELRYTIACAAYT